MTGRHGMPPLPQDDAHEGVIAVTEIDGVRVVVGPGTGTLSAMLGFRVGMYDEPLSMRGISHLVEHLALHRFDSHVEHRNGHVLGPMTQFTAHGSEEHVVAFLNAVCAGLRDLPVERLDPERSILLTEAQSRSGGSGDAAVRARYGAEGPALAAYRELGLDWLGSREVTDWARRWFVAENAVLWISDRIPEGLDLRLPAGEHQPLPPITPQRTVTPAWLEGQRGLLVLEAAVPRSTSAALFTQVFEAALFRTLRLESALSYTAAAQYEPVASDTAQLLAVADSRPDDDAAVVGTVADLLAGMRAGHFDARDVEAARSVLLRQIDDSLRDGSRALMVAGAALMGDELKSVDQQRELIRSVTEADLRDIADVVWSSAIWQTSVGPLDWIGAEPVGPWNDSAVDGVWFEPSASSERVVIGAEGVSVVSPQGVLTVRAEDCRLLATFPDGGKLIIGSNGNAISLEPTLIPDLTPDYLDAFESAVSPVAQVPLPRAPSEVPVPPAPPVAVRPSAPLWLHAVGASLLPLVTFLLFAVLVIGSVIATASTVATPTSQSITAAILVWLFTGVVGVGLYASILRARRHMHELRVLAGQPR